MTGVGRPPGPLLLLAADHRARGVIEVEDYEHYLSALTKALPSCDGILATVQPLADLVARGAVTAAHRTYLSLNRTGLAGSSFELDDRLVATVETASRMGCDGVKHMTRIDLADPHTAGALELLGRVIEDARAAGLDALVEPLVWRDGAVARDTDSVVYAAVIAHDMGAPLLKVAVPDEPPGHARQDAVARVVASVGVPVLFLGGPKTGAAGDALAVARDVMAGGGAGMAVGRLLYQDPDPGGLARAFANAVHVP
jgi:DhnA family fructose-bisphosphate aldolase class Ia